MFTKHELYQLSYVSIGVTFNSGLSPLWPGVTTGIVSDCTLLSRFTHSTQIIWPKAASASGTEEGRTLNLSRARGTLSQLSYSPMKISVECIAESNGFSIQSGGGIEPPQGVPCTTNHTLDMVELKGVEPSVFWLQTSCFPN